MAVKGFSSPTAATGAALRCCDSTTGLIPCAGAHGAPMCRPTHFPSRPSQLLQFRYSRTGIPLSRCFFFGLLLVFDPLPSQPHALDAALAPCPQHFSGISQRRKGAAGLRTEPNHVSKQHHFPFWGAKTWISEKNTTFRSSKNHVMQPLIRISRQI